MAEMIPESISAAPEATTGEKRVFKVLRDTLLPDDDYLVWFEPKAIKKRTDFLIWSQELGLLVMEVKDWVRWTPKSRPFFVDNKLMSGKVELCVFRSFSFEKGRSFQ
jgi:hypothetical protein